MLSLRLWPFFLLLALLISAAVGGVVFAVVLVVWGLAALLALLYSTRGAAAQPATPVLAATHGWQPLVFYAALALPALLFDNLALSALLIAPLAVLMLPTLLGQHDTAASARSWGMWVGWGLWALAGTVSLGLLESNGGLIAPGVSICAGLLGYNAGRRALLIQGFRPQWAHYAGLIVGILGASLLSDPGAAPLHVLAVIGGLLIFYLGERMLPQVAADAPQIAQSAAAVILVQQQLVCTAPLALALMWLWQQIQPLLAG